MKQIVVLLIIGIVFYGCQSNLDKKETCDKWGLIRVSNDTTYIYESENTSYLSLLYYYSKCGCDYRPNIILFKWRKDKYGNKYQQNLLHTNSVTKEMFFEFKKFVTLDDLWSCNDPNYYDIIKWEEQYKKDELNDVILY